MKLEHICFIVPNYPTAKDPMYTFVRELVVAISNLGIKCSVIAPQSITNFIFKRKRKRPFKWQDHVNNKVAIDIYQPIHFPFLNIHIKGNNIAGELTSLAIKYAFNKYKLKPDILYAHFWHSGVIAAEISKKHHIPVFVASGESKIRVESLYSRHRIDEAIREIKGVICVSGKNLDESINLGLCQKENAIIVPNAINNKLFYKKNKDEVRNILGYEKDEFIVIFVGAFTHRKGILRVMKAMEGLNARALFIGSGEQKPKGENILFSGPLPHIQLVNYLNAADVFVLPTLAEGCCNAIIEAMACGLPVVSSNLSFNDELLNEKNSIRIDPNDIEEIRKAIIKLKNDPDLRIKMSEKSLEFSKKLIVDMRAIKLINFIEDQVNINSGEKHEFIYKKTF